MDCYLYVQISKSTLIGIVIVGTVTMMLCVASIWLLTKLYDRKRLLFAETAKRQAAEYAAKLRADRVQEAERVIRELTGAFHDHVGNKLAFLVTILGDLRNQQRRQQAIDPERLQLSRQVALEIMDNVRSLNRIIDATALVENGLLHAVQAEVAILQSIPQPKVMLQVAPDCYDGFNPETALHIIRIIQESVSNTIKHAHASTLTISMSMANPLTFQLDIIDNGRGFEVSALGHDDTMGLGNIRFRAACIAGDLRIDSCIGEGSHITLHVPIDDTD